MINERENICQFKFIYRRKKILQQDQKTQPTIQNDQVDFEHVFI